MEIKTVQKRDGSLVAYDKNKIRVAIKKANGQLERIDQITDREVDELTDIAEAGIRNECPGVEDIQESVIRAIVKKGYVELAKVYIIYRHDRDKVRGVSKGVKESIVALVNGSNKDVMEENSNKNATVASTQRDLIAGEVSKDMTMRDLLPRKIVNAHKDGVLHFHDADYFIQPIFNCCLVNIKDMLDNGTVMNGKMIETPKSFQVACTVMTQIIAAVSCGQYGGQSVKLSHLAKYLRNDYEKNVRKTRLKKGEPIDKLLKGGYSTISLGYIGLYELTKLMTGKSHTDPEATEFAVKVMKYLRNKCELWKDMTGIGFGLYGTPAESLCYRFAKIDKERFGEIKDVTDKGYYTNSYHVDVREQIDAFDKLKFESQFQTISSGGAISYVEIPNMTNNLPVLEELVKFIYDNIQYAEFNTKSDYCMVCGYDGEIIINDDNEWECPQCGNKDHNKMNVTRRTCGYLGANFWNEGKTKEIKARVMHFDMPFDK